MKKTTKQFVIYLTSITFSFLCPILSFAQTGPGGVGIRNGSSNLKVWLRGEDINANNNLTDNPANGTFVNTWADFSGSGNHYSNLTNLNTPIYSTTASFKSVFFNSASSPDFLSAPTSGSYSDGTCFFALKPFNAPAGAVANLLFDNNDYSLRLEQAFNTGNVGYTRWFVADYPTAIPTPYSTNTIVSYNKSAASQNMDITVNNAFESLNTGSTLSGIPYDRIGRNVSGLDGTFADMYEVILYNSRINTAQFIIVNNYLSAKYGSISILNDIYVQDNPVNGNFDFEVAGIGRLDAANLHTDAQGTSIVRILNPTNLNDNEFLIWGHNNALLQATPTDIPAGIFSRFQRVWRANEVNLASTSVDVGAIDMRWDLTGLGPITTTDLRLLVDTDNDGFFFDETPIAGAVSLGGNVYAFNGVTALSNNLRFTLATISATTPLPLELVDFQVEKRSTDVSVNWLVETEKDVDYYQIGRSTDLINWNLVGNAKSKANASQSAQYELVDTNPFVDVMYYRLTGIDNNGMSTELGIRAVSAHSTELTLYPNPSNGCFFIDNMREEDQLTIYDVQGNSVYTSVGLNKIQVDFLMNGIYFCTLQTPVELKTIRLQIQH